MLTAESAASQHGKVIFHAAQLSTHILAIFGSFVISILFTVLFPFAAFSTHVNVVYFTTTFNFDKFDILIFCDVLFYNKQNQEKKDSFKNKKYILSSRNEQSMKCLINFYSGNISFLYSFFFTMTILRTKKLSLVSSTLNP